MSLAIDSGEVVGLLGPNGAGKTTLVRMLVGILQPDTGAITSQGGSEGTFLTPAEIGYLPEDRGLYREMKLLPTLEFFGRLRGMESSHATHPVGSPSVAGPLPLVGSGPRAGS